MPVGVHFDAPVHVRVPGPFAPGHLLHRVICCIRSYCLRSLVARCIRSSVVRLAWSVTRSVTCSVPDMQTFHPIQLTACTIDWGL